MESTLQTYGKFKAYLGVFVSVFIGICMTIFGVFILKNKPKYTNSAFVGASNVTCYSNTCNANVTLKDTTQNLSFQRVIKENENVKVYYTNDTPPKLSSTTDDIPKVFGIGLILCACCIVLTSIIIATVISSSNKAATIYGGISAVSNMKSVLN